MCRFSKGRWVIARDKECANAQRCVNFDKLVNEVITSNVQAMMVVESDQEVKFAVKVNRVVNCAVLDGRAVLQKSHR